MSVPSIVLGQAFVRKLLAFVGNSLLVYDYVITFPLEVAYIWNAPWTHVKACFLINRYGNLIGQTLILLEETGYLSHGSQKFCAAFWIYCALFSVFSSESIRILVLVRAWAIWGCKYRTAVFLITLYIIYIMAVGVMVAYGVKDANSLQFEYLNELGICFGPMPSQGWIIWFGAMSVDGLALAISVFSCEMASLLSGVLSIICLTVFRQDPRNFIQIVFSYPVMSVIGQRLVLNLRGLRARPDSTRDWSREIDRQMAAMSSLEQSWDLEGSGDGGMVELQLLGDGDGDGQPALG